MVACGPIQVAVEYCISAGGLLITAWCCILMVEMVVGTAAVSLLRCLVADHADICWVFEFQAVVTHYIFVVLVHALGFAGAVVYAPSGLFTWDASWDGESWLLLKDGHDCYEAAL